jgi:shikimate kinase
MEDLADRHPPGQPQQSPEEIARDRERDSLQLSRTRVLQDLAAARNPKYRELLERSLRFLDDKLALLERS